MHQRCWKAKVISSAQPPVTLKTAAQERKERSVARKSYRRASIYTKIINNTDGDDTTDEDDAGGGGEGDDAGNDSGWHLLSIFPGLASGLKASHVQLIQHSRQS